MTPPNRIDLLRRSATLVGIALVRVSDDQRALSLFLHHALPLPAALAHDLRNLQPEQIRITALDGAVPAQVMPLAPVALISEQNRAGLHFQVQERGGFGRYLLVVDHPAFDPFSNRLEFSFKAGCPSDLDCAALKPSCNSGERVDFPVDYRARDFWSFRQALLDFAAQRYPDWQDRLEADIGMVLVDMLSALGDEFAYAQDRIAREVRFDTATQRRSLRHLARLVDYPIDDGSGACTWLQVTVREGMGGSACLLEAGLAVTDAHGQIVFELGRGLRDQGKEFAVNASRNWFSPYLWDEDAICLPAGSTSLTLVGHHADQFDIETAIDDQGKWLLLATNPTAPDAPQRRLLVRVPRNGARNMVDPLNGPTDITEITWDTPTPFDLDLTTLQVHGNMVPATSGRTIHTAFRIGPPTVSDTPEEAALPLAIERTGPGGSRSDQALGTDEAPRVKRLFSLQDSDRTPLVWLTNGADQGRMHPEILVTRRGADTWSWLPELIGQQPAKPTAAVYTLEDGTYRPVFRTERQGQVFEFAEYASNAGSTLRFGDGEFGLAPPEGAIFDVAYRLGNGRLMNVAADTLTTLEAATSFVQAITNPLPATGGRDPENEAAIRINAPEAFRAITHRAVRPEDYDTIVPRELDWVQRSGTTIRWTGSWPTTFVTPDPKSTTVLTPAQQQELEQLCQRIRQAGREVRVRPPRYAHIDLQIHIAVLPNAYAGEVEAAVLATLFGADKVSGFFGPDNFTFGTPLSRGALLAAIQQTPGVCAVNQILVRRRGFFDWRLFSEFLLAVGHDEVIAIDNNQLLRQQGAVTLVMEGGA